MRRNADYQFFPVDPEEIVSWLTARYEADNNVTVQPGSTEQLVIRWMANGYLHERALSNYAANQNIPSRAEGENLDALAELFHIRERPGAQAASCTMRFHISEAQDFAVLVPGGTRATDASGTQVWATDGDVYIPPGETFCEVKAWCQTEGEAGNGYVPGQISSIVDPFPYFLSCENITESGGGSNTATDEEFYELMRLSMDAYSTAGARGGYIYHAKKADTKIADVVANSPTPGVVALYVLMDDGTAAGTEIKEKVLENCSADDVRPLTDLVRAEDPEAVTYNVDFTYFIREGSSLSAAAIAEAVRAAVDEYAVWQRGKLGRDINPDRLREYIANVGKVYDEETGGYSGTSAIKRVVMAEPAFTSLRDGGNGTVPQVAALGTINIEDGGYEDE